MNYTSSEKQDYDSTKSGAQQSRGRLTLLSDISETNPNLLLSQQQSPVLTYIRQLQDTKQVEKQNISSFNRKMSQSQDRSQKNNRIKQPVNKQQNIRKDLISNISINGQQTQNKSQSRHSKNINQSNRVHYTQQPTRSGIQRYRKLINLADTVENLQNQYQALCQNPKQFSEYFNEDKDLLFCKQLKKCNIRKHKP